MNDRRTGPRSSDVIGGVVLIFFGLCILLVGGGCTLAWLTIMFAETAMSRTDGWAMLIISIVAAAFGLFAIVKGAQMLRR